MRLPADSAAALNLPRGTQLVRSIRYTAPRPLLHRPQVRMHVVENEDTSMAIIAATSRLETRVPAALRRYQDAVSFFSEWADVAENGTTPAYTPLRQTATSCSAEVFGAGAPDRPDVVYHACRQPVQAKALRVSTGFFEVDDRLHGLPELRVDWDAGTRAACAVAARQQFSKREMREAMRTGILPASAAAGDVD